MARFNGTNDLDTIDLMVERSQYNIRAFPESNGLGPPGIRDFNRWESTKFGRIDLNGNAIVPVTNVFKTLGSTIGVENTSVVHNFVADAFSDMKNHIKRAYQSGLLPPGHPYLSAFAARRAYRSPVGLYSGYTSKLMSIYNNSFLSQAGYKSKVKNFGDYVRCLPDFIAEYEDQRPLTLTGWQRSKHSSIFTSGLVIDIAGQPLSSDSFKDEVFLTTPEFSYYKKLVKYYGFLIHKNAPFVLVADISSPVMANYLSTHGYPSPESVIDNGFRRTYTYDINLLKALLLKHYNAYVAQNPYIKKINFCPQGRPNHKIKYRQATNMSIVDREHRPEFFMNLYIEIRNIEEKKPFKQADIRRIKQKAGFFYKKQGDMVALEYINEQYRSLFSAKEGTLHHWKKREEQKKKNK